MFKKAFLCFYLTLFSFCLTAQDPITEIKGKNREIDGLKGFCRGDSVFISYYDKGYANSFRASDYKAVWLLPNGSQQNLNLTKLANKPFIGATRQNDSSFYYFLDEVKKKIFLKALVQTDLSDSVKEYSGNELSGKLLISYAENDFLFLLLAKKDELKLVKLKGLKVISRTSFSILPLDLSTDKKKLFNLVDNDKINRPGQLTSLCKVIKSSGCLFIVIDDPADFHNEQQSSFKTIVVKLDLADGTAMTKYFFEKSRTDFRTTIFNNKVFRYTDKKDPEITIYDYVTGSVLKKVAAPKLNSKDSLLLRAGKLNSPFLERGSNLKTFISVDSVNNKLIITAGIEIEHDPVVIVPVPVFSLISMAVLAGTVIAGDINDGLKSYFFYCLEGNMETGFQKTNPSFLPNQKINNYEAASKDEVKFKQKLFVSNTKRVFAVYNESGTSDLKVLKFER